MIVSKFVLLLPYSMTFNLEMEANTTMKELFEHIQEIEKIIGNINMWSCFSFERNIYLQIDDQLGNLVGENLVVICQKENEKPKQIGILIHPQNMQFQLKASSLIKVSQIYDYLRQKYQLNNNFQNWQCFSEKQNRMLEPFEMLGEESVDNLEIITNNFVLYKKIQIGQNMQFTIEVEIDTKIYEIFYFIQTQQKLQGDVHQWTCYSFNQQQYIDLNSKINNIQGELLLITIQNGIFRAENLFQTSFDIFNTGNTNYQTVDLFGQNNQTQLNHQQNLQLNIEIFEGLIKRQLVLYFNPNTQIEKVAISILNYLSIQSSLVSLDLFINGHQYNNQKDRIQTLSQCGIKNYAFVIARLRWLDTKTCLN